LFEGVLYDKSELFSAYHMAARGTLLLRFSLQISEQTSGAIKKEEGEEISRRGGGKSKGMKNEYQNTCPQGVIRGREG
jgi:hypothetical protein